MEMPAREEVDLTRDSPGVEIMDNVPLYQRAVIAPIGLGLFPPEATLSGKQRDDNNKSNDEEVHYLQGESYTSSRPPPWLFSSAPSLHQEVKAFAEFMSPTPEERRMREDVIQRITNVIHSLWPYAQVNVFGSSASDLYLPLSDVDMGVVGASGKKAIYDLAYALRRRNAYHDVDTIAKARVPIVKLVDSLSNCQVDISFGTANGAINTAIIKKFCAEAEEIRPLALVLKYYLRQLGLNEPYTGGIGSYTLLLMLISYLQLHRPEGPEGNDLGELLKGFLLLYGKNFNYHRTGISVRNGGFYFQKRNRDWTHPEQPWLLSIEDPGDEENDASRSSYGIMEVRACFLHAHRALTSNSPLFESCPSLLARILLCDPRIEQHRTALRQIYAHTVAPADRKRTHTQRDTPDHHHHHHRDDDDRNRDQHQHQHQHRDDDAHRYRPRPRTHSRWEDDGRSDQPAQTYRRSPHQRHRDA